MQRVTVVDYGMGNLRSVAKAIERVGAGACEVVVSGAPADVEAADRVVFPGQGAIRDCMAEIAARSLGPALACAIASRPFLGICMGLQALMEGSEEHAGTAGLGILAGGVRRFPDGARDADGRRLKIPHMGWNRVARTREHPLWAGIEDGERFYFVHSYFVAPDDEAVIAARTEYGVEFCCAIARGNLFAVQFHPEKSARAGLALLANFLTWDGTA